MEMKGAGAARERPPHVCYAVHGERPYGSGPLRQAELLFAHHYTRRADMLAREARGPKRWNLAGRMYHAQHASR